MKLTLKTTAILLLAAFIVASCTSFEVYDAKMTPAAAPADRIPLYSSIFLGLVETSEPDSITKYCQGGRAAKVVVRTAWYNGLLNILPGFGGLFWTSRTTETYCPQ